ncbi:uncharacterized protein METZ01_LOCUS268060, partial [marine metagenome]
MNLLACTLTVFTAWYAGGDQEALPAWFVRMPEEPGVVYAVGYARAYAVYDSAAAAAARDAAHRLRMAMGSAIIGERLFQTLPGGQVMYQGEKFAEQPLYEVTPVYLDTAQVGGMILVLAVSREQEISLSSVRRVPEKAP